MYETHNLTNLKIKVKLKVHPQIYFFARFVLD